MQETIKRQEKAIKANEAAKTLYPREKWEVLEMGIFIAKSRMPRSAEQINILEKELRQASGLYPNRCTRLSGISIVIFIRRNIVKYRMHTDTIIIRLNVHKNRLSDFLR